MVPVCLYVVFLSDPIVSKPHFNAFLLYLVPP